MYCELKAVAVHFAVSVGGLEQSCLHAFPCSRTNIQEPQPQLQHKYDRSGVLDSSESRVKLLIARLQSLMRTPEDVMTGRTAGRSTAIKQIALGRLCASFSALATPSSTGCAPKHILGSLRRTWGI